jgi:hypothetical protein
MNYGAMRERQKKKAKTYCVHAIPDKMVHPTVVRKTTVACLVRHAPPPSEDDTLGVPVERPKSPFGNGTRI